VLTAAHCVEESPTDFVVGITVRLGAEARAFARLINAARALRRFCVSVQA
jgi:hypothetical protein